MASGKVERMIIKIIGSLLIIASCGYFGIQIAASHRRSTQMMKQLINTISYIAQELRYRMSSLPEIFRQAATYSGGTIGRFFKVLTNEIEQQVAPDVNCCIDAALLQVSGLPELVKSGIKLMGKSLGHFDLDGQLKGLETVHAECTCMLKSFTVNQELRLRSYQTLALCAGAAVTILFI